MKPFLYNIIYYFVQEQINSLNILHGVRDEHVGTKPLMFDVSLINV